MLLPSVRFTRQDHYLADRYAGWAAAVRQFRADWAKGTHPDVRQLRDYLLEVPEQQRSEALQDLVAEHLRHTWQAGYGLHLERYIAEFGEEFSDLASVTAVPADLVEDEFLARYQLPHGDTPPVDEYDERFAGRADVMRLLRRRCVAGKRYVKLRRRGQGAMGEVWEAHDRHLRRSVAIKEPAAGLVEQAESLRRFAEEARVTAGLEHPSIVGVHEFYEANGSAPFYVMRLVSGATLHDRIRQYHQPPMERTTCQEHLFRNQLLSAFLSTCDAIACAHASGVLHRDLKPGNIVVGEFGESVVLDWGIAKRMPPGAATSTGAPPHAAPAGGTPQAGREDEVPELVAGTPDYMPPEQVDGISDARSDVFGLGAILYEILTDRSPHAWANRRRPADWPRLVREARFPSPRRVKSHTPRALEAIAVKALARDPADRYQSAAELAGDTRRYLAGEKVTARPDPVWARASRWFCQHFSMRSS
jgi:serine/threonine protein kinase